MQCNERFVKFGNDKYVRSGKIITFNDHQDGGCKIGFKNGVKLVSTNKAECAELKKVLGINQEVATQFVAYAHRT
jgi:hypothetical protein